MRIANWLRSVRDLYGWAIGTVDGDIGRIYDAYFEDRHWLIRHLVVETGHWLRGRRVLIPPRAVSHVDPDVRVLRTGLTRRQVADSPPTEVAKPVSRQHALELEHYYGFPSYAVYVGAAVVMAPSSLGTGWDLRSNVDPHLRSVRAITGYYVHALDGDVGHAVDFLVDDHDWAIRHLVVSVGDWHPLRKVLVPVDWIAGVSWGASAVEVSLAAEPIRLAPEYEHASGASPEYEARLNRYYGPAPFTSR
jgi:hypothetical protein